MITGLPDQKVPAVQSLLDNTLAAVGEAVGGAASIVVKMKRSTKTKLSLHVGGPPLISFISYQLSLWESSGDRYCGVGKVAPAFTI